MALVLISREGLDRRGVEDVLLRRWPDLLMKEFEQEAPIVAMSSGDAADLGQQQVATVYKRKSMYWVRFQWRGTEVRQSAHTTSKATAQQFLAGLLDEHHRLDRGGRPR